MRNRPPAIVSGTVRSRSRPSRSRPPCAIARAAGGRAGGVAAPFATFRKDAVRWSGDERARYRSSPPVRRSFCGRCGSALAYENDGSPEEIDLYLGVFDDPGRFPIRMHVHYGERVAWFDTVDHTPRFRTIRAPANRPSPSSLPRFEFWVRLRVAGGARNGRAGGCGWRSAAWLRGLGLGQYEQAFRDNADRRRGPARADRRRPREARRTASATAAGCSGRSRRSARRPPRRSLLEPGASPPRPDGERRQVTVLFADLAGYTTLSRELDAEEVHALLDRFFAAADASSSAMAAASTSTSATASWPCSAPRSPMATTPSAPSAPRSRSATPCRAPRPHGSGATRACTSASPAARWWRAASAARRAREYAVTGESVNLASRLTDRAGRARSWSRTRSTGPWPSGWTASTPARSRSRASPSPCAAWRLHGLRAAGPDRRPFVGRRGELGQLRGCSRPAARAGARAAVHLRGEAGIGKTRLVEEFRREAAGRGFACHTGLVLDFGGHGPGRRPRDRPRPAGPGRGGRRGRARGAAERALADGLVDAERAGIPQRPPRPAAAGGAARALRGDGQRGPRPRQARDRGRLVRRASARRPLLLVVEDLHWADADTLAHLAVLAATAPDCPALLVTTSRPQGDPLDAWRARRRRPSADRRPRAAAPAGGAGPGRRPRRSARTRSSSPASSGPGATRSSWGSCCAAPRRPG